MKNQKVNNMEDKKFLRDGSPCVDLSDGSILYATEADMDWTFYVRSFNSQGIVSSDESYYAGEADEADPTTHDNIHQVLERIALVLDENIAESQQADTTIPNSGCITGSVKTLDSLREEYKKAFNAANKEAKISYKSEKFRNLDAVVISIKLEIDKHYGREALLETLLPSTRGQFRKRNSTGDYLDA